jgi:Transposase
MEYFAGIDVPLEQSHVCVVDATGKIVCEAKVASAPEPLVAWFGALGLPMTRIGLEAGPLSQWLHRGLTAAGFTAVLLETRHLKAALSAMIVKTDRKDARGIAQLLRMGWYRPVHVKFAQRPGGAGFAGGAQAAADQGDRRRAEHPRPVAWVWLEDGEGEPGPVCRASKSW